MNGVRCLVLKTMWKRRLVKVFAMVAGIVPREKEPAAPTGLGVREMAVLTWGRRSFVALTPGYIP